MAEDTVPLVSSPALGLHGAGNPHLRSTSIAGSYDRSMTEQSACIPVIIPSSSPHRTVIGPSQSGHVRSLRWGCVAERQDSGEPAGHHRAQEKGGGPGRETESTRRQWPHTASDRWTR